MARHVLIEQEFDKTLAIADQADVFCQFRNQLALHHCSLGDRPLPSFPKPYFLPLEWRASLGRAAELLVSALEKISQIRMRTDSLAGLLPIDQELFELAQIDPGYSGMQLVVRLDAFLDPHTGELKVVEFNCGDPSGMGYNDGLVSSLMDSSQILPRLSDKIETQMDRLCPALAATLECKYREYLHRKGKKCPGRPLLALVCKRGSMIEEDFRGIATSLSQGRFECQVIDPGEFILEEHLLWRGRIVDLIYRDIVDDFLGPKASSGSSVLREAICEQRICLLNPLASAAGDLKNVHTILHSRECRKLFSHDELLAIDRHVPFTQPLEKVEWEWACLQRRQLVLKPNLGFGGHGVVLGFECSDDEWQRELKNAQNLDYTLQEYVPIPEGLFPIQTPNGACVNQSKKVNVNLWVHNGQFSGAFARVSDRSVINVCQGGGIVPVCWVG